MPKSESNIDHSLGPLSESSNFHSVDTPNALTLAAFRTPGFLGHGFGFSKDLHLGNFGFPNQFDAAHPADANSLNLAQGFRHTGTTSPVNLYLGNSNSPSNNRTSGDSVDNSFGYAESRHIKDFDGGYNLHRSRENSPDQKRANSVDSYSSQKLCEDDSLGSQSPQNLSSPAKHTNNNNNNEMLDHKMQLSFLGPPLAALHSMTEMKNQNSPQTHGVNNPHGIDSILSRPTPVTSAQLNALTGGTFKLDLDSKLKRLI